jgi:hypothetical protein
VPPAQLEYLLVLLVLTVSNLTLKANALLPRAAVARSTALMQSIA